MRLTLHTERLTLRPFELEDAQAMFDGWASDPEVTKYLTWPTHQSVETTRWVLGEWLPLYEKAEYLNFAIESKETGQLIGNIAVVGYLEDRTLPVIGYSLSRAHWNKGYMTEACRRVLAYLFEQGFERVRIDADVRNGGSLKVIEKCGGIRFNTAEDERPLKGDTVMTHRHLVYRDPEAAALRYIWLGLDVDAPLGHIWEPLRTLEEQLDIACPLSLPFHISLKMSFPVAESRAEALVEIVEAYFRSQKPFDIEVAGVECHETIVWIRMKENAELSRIHDELNEMLSDRFGVALHEYDRDYLFHTTLCIDEDMTKVQAAYEALKDMTLPATLPVRRFLIGASPDGSLGSYRVIRQVEASCPLPDEAVLVTSSCKPTDREGCS